MRFKAGKFTEHDEETGISAVAAVVFCDWSKGQDGGKCMIVIVLEEQGALRTIDAPSCSFCSEQESVEALEAFYKQVNGKGGIESAAFKSGAAVQKWIIEDLGLSRSADKEAIEFLREKFTRCFEWTREGKDLKSNVIW